jgi:Sigma-70 factor, region 1.2
MALPQTINLRLRDRSKPEDDVMSRLSAASILNSESGLARYLEETRRFPLLTPEEEIEFATRWREYGDRNADDRLVTHQDWIAELAGTTVAGNVSGLVLGVPQRDLKRRIAQDDALQISHAGAPAPLGERPSTVVPEIVAIAHLAGDMTGDHFDHAGRKSRLIVSCFIVVLAIAMIVLLFGDVLG